MSFLNLNSSPKHDYSSLGPAHVGGDGWGDFYDLLTVYITIFIKRKGLLICLLVCNAFTQ